MGSRTEKLVRAMEVYSAFKATQPNKGMPTKVKFSDKTYYYNVNVKSMAGIVELIDTNTKRIVGTTNFDGNKLNAGRMLVIDSVVTKYTTTGTSVENADYNVGTSLPVALLNAELRFKQDTNLLIDLPMTDTQKFKYEDYREISTAPLVKSLEEFGMALEFPKGVACAATDAFLRIELRVIEIKE